MSRSVTAITGLSTYAFITSEYADGVQILDITNPGSPTSVSHISDGAGGYTALAGAYLYHHHHHRLINVCFGGIW